MCFHVIHDVFADSIWIVQSFLMALYETEHASLSIASLILLSFQNRCLNRGLKSKELINIACLLTCWSDPSWLSASLDEFTFCTFPGWALFFTFVDSDVEWELPRFFTFGLGVTEGTYLSREVDDDVLLELLVLVKVLFEETFSADVVTDSVDCAIVVAAKILKDFI